ncbi:MAG: hypothetical protein WD939_00030 [Dehalococcoidia bacterium]
MRFLLVASTVLVMTLINLPTAISAQEKTAEPTPNVEFIEGTWPFDEDDLVIRWEPVVGVAYYHLEATFRAFRVSAVDTLCTPPLEQDRRVLTFDEMLDSGTVEFDLGLPELPEHDEWLVWDSDVTLTAFNENDQRIAQVGAFEIVETNTTGFCSTATPEIVLPDTGTGPDRAPWPGWVSLAVAVAGLTASAGFIILYSAKRS